MLSNASPCFASSQRPSPESQPELNGYFNVATNAYVTCSAFSTHFSLSVYVARSAHKRFGKDW